MKWRVPIFFGSILGLGLSILTLQIFPLLAPFDTFLSRIFLAIHWPEFQIAELLTPIFYPGSRGDESLNVLLFVHPVYWLIIGTSMGLVCQMIQNTRRGTQYVAA